MQWIVGAKNNQLSIALRLLALLSAGGTKDFADALDPFGLDPTSSTFWTEALTAHLGELVNEAEKIAQELGYVE